MNKTHLLAGVAAGLALAAALPAAAQSVDYGSLQAMFNEPVTTSATGSPQRSTEVPVDMTIISAEDIRRSGTTSLPTILSRVAGVDLLNFSSQYSDVGIRGYNQARSPRLLVLVNGRQVYLDHFGYTDWGAIPVQLSEIRQIEVVRGPNSAIFGFNAVSGVVNIITFNPKFDDTNVLQVRGGTQSSAGLSVVKTIHLGNKLSIRASAGTDQQDEWRNGGTVLTNTMIDPSPHSYRGNFDAVAQLSPVAELRMEGSIFNGYSSQPTQNYLYARHKVTTASLGGTMLVETGIGTIKAKVYQNNLESWLNNPRHFINKTKVVSFEDIFKLGSAHVVRLGVEYRDNSEVTTPWEGGKVGYSIVAPSVMWNWTANPKLALTAAARLDSMKLRRTGAFPVGSPLNSNSLWDRKIQETSLNLGAVYKLTPADTLRATYARGVQAQSLLELGGIVLTPTTAAPKGLLSTGNPALEPAIVTNYEIAYDRDIPSLNAKASLKLFAQKTSNVKGQFGSIIDIPATPTTWAVTTYENVADSEMKGVEASAAGKIAGGYHWSGDVAYTDVKDKPFPSAISLVLRRSAFAATTPKYRGNLAAGWSNDRWSVDGFAHHVSSFSSYTGSLLEPVPAYTSLAGRIAYRYAGGIELALSGQNLMHARQSQAKGGPSGLQAERIAMFSVTKTW